MIKNEEVQYERIFGGVRWMGEERKKINNE